MPDCSEPVMFQVSFSCESVLCSVFVTGYTSSALFASVNSIQLLFNY